jgi:hypothetical protein
MDIHLGGKGGTGPGAAGGGGGAWGENAVGGKGGAGGSVRIVCIGPGGVVCGAMDTGVACALASGHEGDHQGLTGCLWPLDKAFHTWPNAKDEDR